MAAMLTDLYVCVWFVVSTAVGCDAGGRCAGSSIDDVAQESEETFRRGFRRRSDSKIRWQSGKPGSDSGAGAAYRQNAILVSTKATRFTFSITPGRSRMDTCEPSCIPVPMPCFVVSPFCDVRATLNVQTVCILDGFKIIDLALSHGDAQPKPSRR